MPENTPMGKVDETLTKRNMSVLQFRTLATAFHECGDLMSQCADLFQANISTGQIPQKELDSLLGQFVMKCARLNQLQRGLKF